MPAHNTIKNCIFFNNTSADKGGAIYLFLPGDLSIDNCTFKQNSAVSGSSIYYEEHDIKTLKLTSNVFIENVAFENGAALYLYDCAGETSIVNSTFSNNLVEENPEKAGSVIYLNKPGNITIINSIFQNNKGIFGACIYYSETSRTFFILI